MGADLQVVRFLAGLGETGDVDVFAADPLGEEGHRVERRDDVERVGVPAAALSDEQAVRVPSPRAVTAVSATADM